MQLDYTSLAALLAAAEAAGKPLSELVLAQQAEELELPPEQVYDRMARRYAVMAESAEQGCDPALRSASGLTGGSAAKMKAAVEAGRSLTGPVLGAALTRALAVSELNAAMGRIVAAPTAGSCGILPAALLTMEREKGCSRHACIMALFTASAVGLVIARNACLAGAQGGCQAECGSAAAMAAAALVQMLKGTPKQALDAAAIALSNLLGLVCDPVGGLVEVPCQNRNAIGVACAFSSAQLALSGIESLVPFDEMAKVMLAVGHAMPSSLRETAKGGIATAPSALAACARCGTCA